MLSLTIVVLLISHGHLNAASCLIVADDSPSSRGKCLDFLVYGFVCWIKLFTGSFSIWAVSIGLVTGAD